MKSRSIKGDGTLSGIVNNKGLVNTKKPTDGIYGLSKDGSFKIQIQMSPDEKGNMKISSFFSTFNSNLK